MDLLMNVAYIQFCVFLKHTPLCTYLELKVHNFALTSKRLRLPGLGLLGILKYSPWQGEPHTKTVLSVDNKMLGEKRRKLEFLHVT